MQELPREIPDVSLLLALEPEELGAKILFFLKRRMESYGQRPPNGQFNIGNLESELWQSLSNPSQPRYPLAKREEINLALSEAFAWLEAQGLLIPAPGASGEHGWRFLSRRAHKIASEAKFATFAVSRILPKELLHPKIADLVWGEFMRGEFDVAAFQAMKGVEVAVRDAAELGHGKIGTDLMQEAFAPEKGPLTDTNSEKGEQLARMRLFAGAIGSYKNPHSHRDVNLDDPYEALEIVLLANHLLRIVDARAKARGTKP